MTQDELKSRLHYDPETGVFTWLDNPDLRGCVRSRLCGKEAGCVTEKGYVRIRIGDKGHRAHRLAFLYMYGYMPEEVDHIDGDTKNNAISNLRGVTHAENLRNMKKGTRNTSGVIGVSYRASEDKWLAYITVDRKRIHGGLFASKKEAVKARKALEKKYGFHQNHGR